MKQATTDSTAGRLTLAFLLAAFLQIAFPLALGFVQHIAAPIQRAEIVNYSTPYSGSIAAAIALVLIPRKAVWPLILTYAVVSCGVTFLMYGLIIVLNSSSNFLPAFLFTLLNIVSLGAGIGLGLFFNRYLAAVPIVLVASVACVFVIEQRRVNVASERFAKRVNQIQSRLPDYLENQALPLIFPNARGPVKWDPDVVEKSYGLPMQIRFSGHAGKIEISAEGPLTVFWAELACPTSKLPKSSKKPSGRETITVQDIVANGLNPSFHGFLEDGNTKEDGSYHARAPGYGSVSFESDVVKVRFEITYDAKYDVMKSQFIEVLRLRTESAQRSKRQ